MGGKTGPDDTSGNDEQAVFSRRAVKTDEAFRILMMGQHRDRFVAEQPVPSMHYIARREGYPPPMSPNGSPAALCADVGSKEGRGQAFVSR